MFLIILLFTVTVHAKTSCQNTSGYKVEVLGTGTIELVTPYESISVEKPGGRSDYYYSTVSSDVIRSFSLYVKGEESRLLVVKKGTEKTIDRQKVNCIKK